MKKINKIFILHYSKLVDRKAHMLEEAQKWFSDTPYEFIESWDQEQLNEENIKENFLSLIILLAIKKNIQNLLFAQ